MPPVGRVAWGVLLAGAGALEYYGIRNPQGDDTLSEFTRWAFHVDTPAGRGIFAVAWTVFAVWFLKHIVTWSSSSTSSKEKS